MRNNIRQALNTIESFDKFCENNGFQYRSVHETDGFEERRELQLAISKAGARDGVDAIYQSMSQGRGKPYKMTIAFKNQIHATKFRLLERNGV